MHPDEDGFHLFFWTGESIFSRSRSIRSSTPCDCIFRDGAVRALSIQSPQPSRLGGLELPRKRDSISENGVTPGVCGRIEPSNGGVSLEMGRKEEENSLKSGNGKVFRVSLQLLQPVFTQIGEAREQLIGFWRRQERDGIGFAQSNWMFPGRVWTALDGSVLPTLSGFPFG